MKKRKNFVVYFPVCHDDILRSGIPRMAVAICNHSPGLLYNYYSGSDIVRNAI